MEGKTSGKLKKRVVWHKISNKKANLALTAEGGLIK